MPYVESLLPMGESIRSRDESMGRDPDTTSDSPEQSLLGMARGEQHDGSVQVVRRSLTKVVAEDQAHSRDVLQTTSEVHGERSLGPRRLGPVVEIQLEDLRRGTIGGCIIFGYVARAREAVGGMPIENEDHCYPQ